MSAGQPAVSAARTSQPATREEVLCARCAVGVDAERVAEVTAVLSAATQLVLVSAMRPEEAIRSTVAALAVTPESHKAPTLCDAAQGRDLVRERLAAAEELRQDIGRISARRADGVTTSALAVALADAGWVKVPLAESSEGR
ncbi:hypothetical protein CHO01_25360 [Cellulomonas hominis]|uniref:Uncharacterized protein n=1 Tax=Cellulomonas hominis TaxID=156981 RepID=A0A511FDT4_9CELL|nr:hypothetical protein [Cellulomonas hominis]MBB5472503.1 hypothetical protein [Cellulomonas hominis]NKY05873.1 hypothetical protein [Cellulomonas hominis]GEL47420.1 hypothetical protein CHO01_25360 [Cellulomonas hominis]